MPRIKTIILSLVVFSAFSTSVPAQAPSPQAQGTAAATPSVQVQPPFAPITLDAVRWNEVLQVIDSISMPPPVYRQLMNILQQLETRAQQEAAAAAAAKPAGGK